MLFTLALAACSGTQAPSNFSPPTQTLLLYSTAALSPTWQPDQTNLLPTPTPRIYTIVEGDTLFEIAAGNGITVDLLLLANPGIDARFLTPGTQLVIPLPDSTVVPAIPSPTPAQVLTRDVKCYASAAGELRCFLLVENENDGALENVVGVVQILDADGDTLITLEAVPLLNLLPAGASMPLFSYAAQAPQGWAGARGQVVSAYPVAAGDEYYLEAQLQNAEVEISESKLAANLRGQIRISGDQEAGVVWVLAVAYSADGEVVGVQRWERQDSDEFSFWVYSLGAEIAEVDLLIEARP